MSARPACVDAVRNLLPCFFGLLLASPAFGADPAAELRESAQGVIRANQLFERERFSEINLDREIAVLGRLIDGGALNPAGLSVARYWRARAHTTLNWVRMNQGGRPDPAIAQAALADYEGIIANNVDVPGWGVSVSDAYYGAGGVARNHLEEHERAYGYWGRCAERGHAGCLNIMASGRLTGAPGIKQDLEESIELNKRVYDTGTDYRCAGAFSALLIAETIHFGGLKPTVDELGWLQRAYPLLEEIRHRDKLENPCDYPRFQIAEYLVRLSRGERKPELLRKAAEKSGKNDFKAVAEYLLGERPRQSFEESLRGINLKHIRCAVNFFAWWHASLDKQPALSEAHLRAMSALGGEHCRIELGLIKLKK